MINVVRCFVAPWYLLGWILHLYVAGMVPQMYSNFGNTAILPLMRDLWQTVIVPNVVFFALSLGFRASQQTGSQTS